MASSSVLLQRQDEAHTQRRELLEKRFPSNESFFQYHASKAKVLVRARAASRELTLEDQEYIRWIVQKEISHEWSQMDLWAASEWAELRMRLLKGNERYLRSASAAHLFQRGRAKTVGSQEGRASFGSTFDFPWSDEHECVTASRGEAHHVVSRPEPCRPVPARSVCKSQKHQYRSLRKSSRIVFVRLPVGTNLKPFQLADACRAKLGSIQRNICEDARMISPGLCIVRLRHKASARRLIGRHINVEHTELKIHAYPSHSPRTFTADILYDDPSGIDMDSIQHSIAELFAEASFDMHVDDLEDEQRADVSVTFTNPVKTLCFDVEVRTAGGLHILAHFYPTTRPRSRLSRWGYEVDNYAMYDIPERASSCGSSCGSSCCGSSMSSSSSTSS